MKNTNHRITESLLGNSAAHLFRDKKELGIVLILLVRK
jgi:hypothetical protein